MAQELKVHNANFLLERLAQDCAFLQWVRELTQNALEAIQRAIRDGLATEGKVWWDLSWGVLDEDGLYKLRIVDTGCGMTGDDLVHYIGHLSCSGGVQGMTNNYGIGAKIAAFPHNAYGIIYTSLVPGASCGHRIIVRKDEVSGKYVLSDLERPDGGTFTVQEVALEDLPEEIREAGHGTEIILLGNDHDENTFRPDAVKSGYWLLNYLNSKYYVLPPNVEMRVRIMDRPNHPDTWSLKKSKNVFAHGQKHHLDKDCQTHGRVDLDDVYAYWWLMPRNQNRRGRAQWKSGRHVAIIYQNELYDLDERLSKMCQFGVGEAGKFCVIYIEPKSIQGQEIIPTASRSGLRFNGEEPPWHEWGIKFLEKMPKEIADLKRELDAELVRDDHTDDIRREMDNIRDLFDVQSFRMAKSKKKAKKAKDDDGDDDVLEPTTTTGGTKEGRGKGRHCAPALGLVKSKGTAEDDPITVKAANLPFPEVVWVRCESLPPSERDEELLDRAAKYDREPQGDVLRINEDFRLFQSVIRRVEEAENPQKHPKITALIKSEVKRVYARVLVESVIGVHTLVGSQQWDHDALHQALSPLTLTVSVQQRYNQWQEVRRRVRSVTKQMGSQLTKDMHTTEEATAAPAPA